MGEPVSPGELLAQINSPEDLRKLPLEALPRVCDELRDFLIRQIAQVGGHFGASLGVVELTVALHYVFRTPYDLIVWDVGHQAYGHKVLTGRRDQLHTIRQWGGISGFPVRAESPYDTFGVGHSSTSIAAGVGMAIAARLKGEHDRVVVTVIGDGALTAGLAYEGLNNAGAHPDINLLIILNDNRMSIDPNVGALVQYLTDLTTTSLYNRVREEIWRLLGKLSIRGTQLQDLASRLETSIKSLLSRRSNLFEALGIRYFGPEDGHDVIRLVQVLQDLKNLKGPRILHLVTVKGKGYPPAEKDQVKWHSTGRFDVRTGKPLDRKKEPAPPKYQDVFGKSIIELARKNPRIVAITPAMPTGSSLVWMMKEMPDRAFDVGIAEQFAVTFAAGLATQGLLPYVAIYSTFLQRAYDQLIHDVALQDLHVVFCIDRAGLVGADGPTHHGAFDIAYTRCVPNMIVCAPANEAELRHLLYTAQLDTPAHRHPWAIRYPRGQGVLIDWHVPFEEIPIGKGVVLQEGEDLAIIAYGHAVNLALAATHSLNEKGIYPTVVNARFVKPLDEALMEKITCTHRYLITVEDGVIHGGFGSALLEFLARKGLHTRVRAIRLLGIPDQFIPHGTPQQQHAYCGFDAPSIVRTALDMLGISSVEVSDEPTAQNVR